MSRITTVVPTFTLFRVDPAQVVKEYHAGVYSNIVIPRVGNVSLNYSSLVRPVYGHSPDDATFCFHNRAGLENVFVTTDHIAYKTVNEENKPITNRECDWCHIFCTHDMVTMPVGITATCRHTGEMIPVYLGQRPYCDFECMYAHFRDRERGADFRDPPKSSTGCRIKSMYALCYPNGPELQPAPYYGLLDRNGGHLSKEEFKNRSHHYIPTRSFIMMQVKEVYQRVEAT